MFLPGCLLPSVIQRCLLLTARCLLALLTAACLLPTDLRSFPEFLSGFLRSFPRVFPVFPPRFCGVAVRLSCHPLKCAISPEAATNIYRIIQEALTNVARYAGATEVTVEVGQSTRGLQVSVSDNGKGFETSRVADPHAVGLIGMQERARLIGGKLDVRSAPGAGTTVSVAVPLLDKGQPYDHNITG
jgi:signal transduction histidine kinase